ncbi:hypothetical protein EV699_10997 [Plasticicumulans lactativorans]|uniref:Lipoprotein n=1 Tax=Plasticicumulans lactativorans TaxID=1133106 RepID=A0A4R2L5X9_9GAMM|nr:hypothetical protein [Plasticicumulans lactativorans]TCO81255.1 hypothetical protein EV699_10997 [Plasticicumulans lactativorans]
MQHPFQRPRGARRPPRAAGLALALSLGGCSWLPWGWGTPTPAAAASPVQIEHAGLLAARSGRAEIGLTLASAATRTLWLSVRFQTPGGEHDCLQVRELAPQSRQSFACPQARLSADADYRVTITAFEDAELLRPLAPLGTTLRFTPADLHAAGQR